MDFIELKENDHRKYNDFVASQNTGSFLQAWEWGEMQRSYNSSREVFRFGIEGPEGLVAAGQVIKMPLFSGRYYVYLPYGPTLKETDDERTIDAFIQGLKKYFPGCVFIRIEPKFKPIYDLPGEKTINIQPGRTLVIDLRKSSGEILAGMHPKTRYNIRIAEKHGVRIDKQFVVQNGHGLYFKEAIDLILDTAKRQGYVTHPASYYEKMINFFSLHNPNSSVAVSVYKALYQEKLLATAIMIDFDGVRTYLFGGSSNAHRNVMAPYLLHYQAMLDASEQSRRWYDFDGLEQSKGKEAGFARFKLGFGGEILEYSGAYDIVNQRTWYTAYKALRKGNRLLKQFKK